MKLSLIVATRPFHRMALALLLLLNHAPWAHAAVPVIAGQVTASTSATDFEVNGEHVLCDRHTEFGYTDPADAPRFPWTAKPYLGEPLQIYGNEDRKAHLIHAKRVIFAPSDASLHGQGIIDRILAPQAAGSLLVRADGYPILVTGSTQINFVDPLHSLADIHTNQWLEYHGRQRKDGVLVADRATLRLNTVSGREEKLDHKYQYAPSAVPANNHQPGIQRFVTGADPKQIPPSQNLAMQNRIDAIGSRLIPAYQRELPDSDPTKIFFRFQLIEDKHVNDLVDLPTGTILVPLGALTRLQNDDQIAAYLAAGVATVFEKQQVRDAIRKRLLTAAAIGGLIEFPLPISAETADIRANLIQAEMQQRIRVSLALIHDAGYDLTEAPKMWWLLASKDRKSLTDIPIPDTAIYAYAVLGSTWRDTAWEK